MLFFLFFISLSSASNFGYNYLTRQAGNITYSTNTTIVNNTYINQTANLSGYVPYVGATQNINLDGTYGLIGSFIRVQTWRNFDDSYRLIFSGNSIYPQFDGTIDLGFDSGGDTNRFRDGFFSRNFVIGGQIQVGSIAEFLSSAYIAGNLEVNGTVKFRNYTSNGFLKTNNSDGTLYVDTNTYLTNDSQYLLVNGSRNMSGNLNMGGNNITNVKRISNLNSTRGIYYCDSGVIIIGNTSLASEVC